MTFTLPDRYTGRASAISSSFPLGSFKNESTDGADDGTPLEIDWVNDRVESYRQAMLAEAGITADDVNDSADTSLRSEHKQAARMNWAMNSRARHATMADVCSGLPGKSWHNPTEALNLVDSGYTVIDSAVCWDYGSASPYLLIITPTAAYPVTGLWDYSAAPVVGSAFGFTFPDTLGYLWGVCCDQSNIYLLWSRSSDGARYVSKYACSLSGVSASPTWTTAALGATTEYSYSRLIVANDSYLAVSILEMVGTYTGPGVQTISKSTGAIVSGKGNNDTEAVSFDTGVNHFGRLLSDGTDLFWLCRDGTHATSFTYTLCSANISDPTTYNYSRYDIVTSADPATDVLDVPAAFLNIGEAKGTVAIFSRGGSIWLFDKEGDVVTGAYTIAEFTPSEPAADHYDIFVCHDCLNAWVGLYAKDRLVPSTGNLQLYKIPLGSLSRRSLQNSLTAFISIYPRHVACDYNDVNEEYRAGTLLFDSQSLYFAMRTGEVFRLPNPGGI